MTSHDNLSSREIVRRCIEFDNPPRIAVHFLSAPIQGRVWDETDFALVSYQVDPQFRRLSGQDEWTTEWGVKKRAITTPLGEAVGFPLSEGWHRLGGYRFPDFEAEWRWEHLRENVERAHAAGKYVYAPIPSLMQLSADLRGMENWFMDHVLEPENLAYLLDRLLEMRVLIIERYAAAGVDGVITWDDMGSNDRAFVSPETFRELYLPRYTATIDLLHQHGMHFIHHCCGQVRDLMDMIVEAGCDVLQLDQPTLMGIDWLGERYRGRLCFWNCVDIQRTMTAGDLGAIEAEARRQVSRLGSPRGGFMVKSYAQPEAVGITAAQADQQCRAFKRCMTQD